VVLTGLRVADEPATWQALGFATDGGRAAVGGVRIELAGRAAGEGILAWSVDGLRSDVLPSFSVAGATSEHPHGVVAVDHVVAVTGDMDATLAALAADGLRERRVRDAGNGLRQAFYVLGTALLELGGPVAGEAGPRFWGLTLVVEDLDELAERLGPLLGPPRDAVQPGRRIATLAREAGSSLPMAFMTPR
jgi:hypothetical protein